MDYLGVSGLRVSIDRRWEARDFVELIEGVESIYYKFSPRRGAVTPSVLRLRTHTPEKVRQANASFLLHERKYRSSDERLWVKRISFGSPGDIDFLGIGKAIEATTDLIQALLKIATERRLRRELDIQEAIRTKMLDQERDLNAINLQSAKVELARQYAGYLKEFGINVKPDTAVELLLGDLDKLSPMISEGQVSNIQSGPGFLDDGEGSREYLKRPDNLLE